VRRERRKDKEYSLGGLKETKHAGTVQSMKRGQCSSAVLVSKRREGFTFSRPTTASHLAFVPPKGGKRRAVCEGGRGGLCSTDDCFNTHEEEVPISGRIRVA